MVQHFGSSFHIDREVHTMFDSLIHMYCGVHPSGSAHNESIVVSYLSTKVKSAAHESSLGQFLSSNFWFKMIASGGRNSIICNGIEMVHGRSRRIRVGCLFLDSFHYVGGLVGAAAQNVSQLLEDPSRQNERKRVSTNVSLANNTSISAP